MSSNVVKVLASLVALGALGAGVYVWLERTETVYLSETITRSAPELGQAAHLLLPNLNNKEVTVIDRPHEPSEALADDRFDRITRLRVFHVSTNSIGLRGPELDEPKERFRILCVGDSVTFGWGVSYEESYPARLQYTLRQNGHDVEVVNAGVPAMKPAILSNWVTQQVEIWNPDVIVFARRPDHQVPEPYQDFQYNVGVIRTLTRLPVLVVLPPVSTFDVMGSRSWEEEHQWLESNLDVPVLELTPAFREEAESYTSGVRLEFSQNGRQRMLQMPGRRIVVEGEGGDTLDPAIIEAFEADPSLEEPLFFDGGHPTSEGYALFAEEVASFLRRTETL